MVLTSKSRSQILHARHDFVGNQIQIRRRLDFFRITLKFFERLERQQCAHHARIDIYLGSTLLGIGIGLAFAALANLIVEAVPPDQTGVATGVNTIARSLLLVSAGVALAIPSGRRAESAEPAKAATEAGVA